MQRVTRAQIEAFVGRDWERVRDWKIVHWAKLWRERGPLATATIGWELYAHARRVQSEFPSRASRRADLDAHLALARKLDAVSHVFRHA
jgi:hypothetical protein